MAIKANEGGTPRDLYTGIATMEIVAISPSMEEIKRFFPNTDKEIQYITDKHTRVDFWLENKDYNILTKVSFFLTNESKVSKTNKYQYIDVCGNTKWLESLEGVQKDNFFNPEGARLAITGEEDLTRFISKWASQKKEDPCRIDNIAAVCNGDFSEIKAVKQLAPNNKILVYLTIRETDKGNYQSVYSKSFSPGWSKKNEYMMKTIKEDTYLKDYIGRSEVLTKFDAANTSMPTPMPRATTPSMTVGEAGKLDDDIPF